MRRRQRGNLQRKLAVKRMCLSGSQWEEKHLEGIDFMKKVLGYLRRAVDEFDMIRPKDTIAVGISGGKDSMLLLYAMHLCRKYWRRDFDIKAITVDLGYDGFETSSLKRFIEGLGIEYIVEKTQISQIVFDVKKESSPCALCAKLRKGAFYAAAKREGCNKAAFAHHMDDLIETLLMSLFYEGRINTFAPLTHLTRQDITLIRPFIYLPEKEIIAAVRKYDIPVSKNPCPVDGQTKRQEVKELIKGLVHDNPLVKKNILAAIRNQQNYNLWDKINVEYTSIKIGENPYR